LLGSADFTATNGTTVVLAAGASAGDLVETVSFYVSSVVNAIPAVAGAVNSTYLQSGITITSPTITSPTISGTYTAGTSLITSGTAVASTSGTSIDFTGIPSWVKRITVMFNGVSTNGSSLVIVQLGTSSGVETSSYLGNSQQGGSPVAFSTGFIISTAAAAASVRYGAISIALLNSNVWTVQGVIADTNNTWTTPMAGVKSLSSTLDRVRITTVNGTDTFDAGTINILYE
jgi:hypothetical protein